MTRQDPWWHFSFPLVPTLILGLLPKCPLCLMALATSVGLGYFVQTGWLVPLTVACFVVALMSLAIRARRQRNYTPLVLGVFAVAIIFVGRYQLNHGALLYAGLALLVFASFWRAGSKKRVSPGTGCEC